MKLEDINKKNVFKTPQNYFDELPGKIQSRVQERKETKPGILHGSLFTTLQYALPALLLVVLAGIYFFDMASTDENDPNQILAQIESTEIIAYLELTDLTTNDIIESINWEEEDLDFLAEEPILLEGIELESSDFDELIDEYGFDGDDLL